ncbi:DUF3102 domain-containing protein [Limosilactobacillus mucosae]|uniref:DUF3102 domain-containing protein n=1 Tax=Limosilactobacillus mucosae TaxID=97478 RepID=UPI000FFBE977|nr:DUF3102 domain-containing protein [Limosilactobacillus mucosae]RXA58180.1 hypothetical protein EQ839_03030 [Limosilactobacillus mucosae]
MENVDADKVLQNIGNQQLSNNIDQITTEILWYENTAGQAIFEIGRRLNWVKKHDLAHGQFIEWLSQINMNERQATRFMKIESELSNRTPGSDLNKLGITSLYLIATLPPDERDKPQQLSSGETKKPVDMTKRELEELKKRLNQRDKELADAKETIADQEEQLDGHRKREVELNQRLTNASKAQRVVEKPVEKVVTKEVKPKDYDGMKQQLSDMRKANDDLTNHLRDTAVENDKLKKQLNDYENLDKQNSQVKHWQNKGKITVYKVNDKMREFLTEMKLMSDDRKTIEDAGESALEDLNNRLDDMQNFINDMRKLTNGRRTVEGEIIQ